MTRFLMLLIATLLIASPTTAVQAAGTLERIKENQVIRIGYRDATPPMSFVDDSGSPAGYSIDICTRIATATKTILGSDQIKTEMVEVTAENRFDKLANGDIDILCGASTVTLERRATVDFSQLIFVTGANLLSRQDERLGTISDLAGKKVAVTKGTTTMEILEGALKISAIDATPVPVDSSNEGLQAVRDGEADALAADQVTLIGLLINAEDKDKFVISTELFSYEPLALAVRRNDADFRLVVDRVIAFLYKTRQIDDIYAKWFAAFGASRPTLVEAMYRLGATPD